MTHNTGIRQSHLTDNQRRDLAAATGEAWAHLEQGLATFYGTVPLPNGSSYTFSMPTRGHIEGEIAHITLTDAGGSAHAVRRRPWAFRRVACAAAAMRFITDEPDIHAQIASAHDTRKRSADAAHRTSVAAGRGLAKSVGVGRIQLGPL